MDTKIAEDTLEVFGQLVQERCYPHRLGYDKEFKTIVRRWRSNSSNDPR